MRRIDSFASRGICILLVIRFKQTCFVSTRLDITGSPLSVFAHCLFLLAVCFCSLSVFCRLRALRPVSSVLSAYMVYDGCLLLSGTKTSQNFSFTELVCFKGVLHPWTLFFKTLCIFSKNKATSDKVSYGSGQKCFKELKTHSFTSVETIVVQLQ